VDFDKVDSQIVRLHSFPLKEIKTLAKHMLSEKEERLISLMRLTGGNAWNDLYEKTTSNLLCDVEIHGDVKKLPLMRVRNMAYDKDKEVRKAAYDAELKACDSVAEVIAQSLNSIKGEFLTEVNLRGYNTPLEPMLFENRISEETFHAMMDAVKESMPKLRMYMKKKAQLLGYTGGLPWYDMFAPIGGYDRQWTFDEARSFVVEKLSIFSKELGQFINNAFDKNWIDAEVRQGKRGGAFCESIKAIKESRVLMSFDGTLDNVLTIAHELGHAFHNYCLKDETPLNSSTPATLAETAKAHRG